MCSCIARLVIERERLSPEASGHLAFWSRSGWKTQPSFRLIIWVSCKWNVRSWKVNILNFHQCWRKSSCWETRISSFPLCFQVLFIFSSLGRNCISSICWHYPLVISIVPPLWWVSLLGQIYTSTEAWIKKALGKLKKGFSKHKAVGLIIIQHGFQQHTDRSNKTTTLLYFTLPKFIFLHKVISDLFSH